MLVSNVRLRNWRATRKFIGYEEVTEVMHIWLKSSERHKVDPQVMKEKIDEN